MHVRQEMRDVKDIIVRYIRKTNEIEWARNNGFTIIRVTADDETRLQRAQEAGDNFRAEDLRHETELYVDSIEADYDIWNGEGVSEDDLRRKIDEILAEIKAKGGR